jgi:pyruvate,orthophosphate dikinase
VTFVFDCDQAFDGMTHEQVAGLIGGKAANLALMATQLGLPVPPAFAVSTQACNAYLAGGWPDGLDAELREHMARLEAKVGRRFGDPADPLLVSVRSGAPVSMPGMMDTILNLGLNEATTSGLAARSGDPGFAADCRSRFETMFRDIVGVDEVPADPWLQLRSAVEAVFRSWNSERARAYREREGIPGDLGTAVTVQAMVFGNLGEGSGTGVLFTRDPATGAPVLYGDVLFDAQGEDVVAGTHRTEPIAALDERLPEVGRQLREHARRLEHHHRDVCDIEFTIERGVLWMLQCRIGKRSPRAALRIALDMAQDPAFPLSRDEAVHRVAGILADPPTVVTERAEAGPALATGLAASPGVAAGEIAVTPEGAVAAANAGRPVILVREETSPDDVHGMARAAGVLTSTGGLASHAAVVARGWGIPAVVGASAVVVEADGVQIGDRLFAVGDSITIDGGTGEVFAGVAAGVTAVVPEAATLLAWAGELGIEIPRPGALPVPEVAEPGAPPVTEAALSVPAALRILAIKGYVAPEALAAAVPGSTTDDAAGVLDGLVADGLAELAAGSFRLTADGKAMGRELLEADAAAWGPDRAEAALDAFLQLDGRVKTIATAWQMRDVDGAPVFNDHTDAAYDAGVLADLAAVHVGAMALLARVADELPRLAAYGVRLEAANAAAQAGDGRYMASPRVDSYHGIWFELHEDLILLAGRNRADEVKAGRA